jgi:lipoic acid synthetase
VGVMSITIHQSDKAVEKMTAHRSRKLWPAYHDLPKPAWLKKRVPSGDRLKSLQQLFEREGLVTVCQEASCPNLVECYSHGIATFMIMGDKCTRRCSFCDVAHGRPDPLDPQEPQRLAQTISRLNLQYVVITSVDRDDLIDGGASHFVACLQAIRLQAPSILIEILVPDFRGRQQKALHILQEALPDVFNHNIETVPSLYEMVRPGSDYQASLDLIAAFKKAHQSIMTKSGIMLGLGEQPHEIEQVLQDLKAHGTDSITVGQYLPPSKQHYPLQRYVPLEEFDYWKQRAIEIGFQRVASGPFVRSSYHAEEFAGLAGSP